MKVIFVASGNKKGGSNVSAFVQSQYDSLKKEELEMRLIGTEGKGAKAYLRTAWKLRKIIRAERPDVVHGHYSLCGWVANMACLGLRHKPKIVVSILGSFPTKDKKWKLVRWSIQHLWDATIVKSQRTANQLGLPVNIIPNGVNLEIFQTQDNAAARKAVGFEDGKKYIIWCSNPDRPEKDWALAQAAVELLEENIENKIENNNDSLTKKEESQVTCSNSNSLDPQSAQKQAFGQPDAQSYSDTDKSYPLDSSGKNNQKNVSLQKKVQLVAVYNKTPEEVCTYMNAADCLLLTSWSEGSPNVIKEAMACNCPIVTTNVGDVEERLAGLEGCFIVPERVRELGNERVRDVAQALKTALEFGKRTEGRKRIIADQLEISQIAKRIKEIYECI